MNLKFTFDLFEKLWIKIEDFHKHANLSLQVLHGLLKRLRGSSLMVTQDGHSPVGPVVGQDLGWNVVFPCRQTARTSCFLHIGIIHNCHTEAPTIPKVWLCCKLLSFYSLDRVTLRWIQWKRGLTVGGDVPLVSSFNCCCRVIEAL